ncbi:MAG TPA: hypothetical protein VIZ18_13620 [Ktedonobacteraceae bacterium]
MAEEKSSVIVAVFQDMTQAKQAYNTLRSSGFGDDYLGLADPNFENSKLGKELAQAGVPDSDSQFYQRQFEAGHPLVTLRVGGLQPESIEKARAILKQNGAYDAMSADHSRSDFASNVNKDARSPFFDLKTGVKNSEDTK